MSARTDGVEVERVGHPGERLAHDADALRAGRHGQQDLRAPARSFAGRRWWRARLRSPRRDRCSDREHRDEAGDVEDPLDPRLDAVADADDVALTGLDAHAGARRAARRARRSRRTWRPSGRRRCRRRGRAPRRAARAASARCRCRARLRRRRRRRRRRSRRARSGWRPYGACTIPTLRPLTPRNGYWDRDGRPPGRTTGPSATSTPPRNRRARPASAEARRRASSSRSTHARATALGPAARARRHARLVGGPEGHPGRPEAQPPRRPHRGPPARVPRLPRRDPGRPVRRRAR